MTPETACWLRQFDQRQVCLGKSERCHLVPRRLLRRLGVPDFYHWDRDLLVIGCAFHHKRFDDECFRIKVEELPEAFGDAVDTLRHFLSATASTRELNAWLSRKYGAEAIGTYAA